MAYQKLVLRPGFNSQVTQTVNEAGWTTGDNVRFRDGLPQKTGGYDSILSDPMDGVPRSIIGWRDLSNNLNAGIGTHRRLYIYRGGVLYDITPFRRSVTLPANSLATVNTSNVVTVSDTAHGAATGDVVYISGASAFNNVTIAGEYTVTVTTANAYTIVASTVANATGSGGGAAILVGYLLPAGLVSGGYGLGWGAGKWSESTWGTPRTAGVITSSAYLRIWYLSNWGELLITNPTLGRLYVWTPVVTPITTRAVEVVNGTPAQGPPLIIGSSLVGMPERHMILLGTSDLNSESNYDPLLIRWSDVEDYTQWLATATNTAGSFRLQNGTRIMRGIATTQQIVIWTDRSIHSMRFIGGNFVYRFDRLGTECGLIGPNAAVDFNGVTYYMGYNAFFAFSGGAPVQIPCSEYTTIFGNLTQSQTDKITCGLNSGNNEVTWFYPDATSIEPNCYATYNFLEKLWYTGHIDRTSWMDRDIFTLPYATSSDGNLFAQESGVDANGGPLVGFIESGWFDLADGEEFIFVDRMLPDFSGPSGGVGQTGSPMAGSVDFYIKTVAYPWDTPRVQGPFNVMAGTKYVSFRARGRQACIRVEWNNLGDWSRMGAVRISAQADGRQ